MSRFVEIDGCPVPTALADAVREVKRRTGASLVTCYRGEDPQAVAIMHAHGKHSQGELWAAWFRGDGAQYGVLGTPNRPGTSTHELYSDGVAYPGPVGRHLDPWECGMDWPDAAIPEVMAAFAAIGACPIHPYASGAEFHHINLRRPPRLFRPLKRGSVGPRVGLLTHRLRIIERAGGEHLVSYTGRYGTRVVAAVVRFQHEHRLKADGVCGPVTWRNVEAAARKARKAKAAAR